MEGKESKKSALWSVIKRECRRMVSRPLYLFCMVIAPLFCYIFFTTLMSEGLPANLPTGMVDLDNSSTSRSVTRSLDAFRGIKIVAHYATFAEARDAVQKGNIYGFYYIPEKLEEKAQASRQPKLSFYTNNSYFIAGSLIFKDTKMMSELVNGAASQASMYARGATEEQVLGFLQAIKIDTHSLKNPWFNYSVYLNTTILPGMLMILIFMITVYSLGVEIKQGTGRQWLKKGNYSIYISLAGKFLPQTAIFFLMSILYNVYLFGYLHFPCNNGIIPMILSSFLFVLASQSLGIVMFGLIPSLRMGLGFASLWGILSFSICGFTFPSMAMPVVFQKLAVLFPLRHYFLIYVDQALNGYSIYYSLSSYGALLLFIPLVFTVTYRIKINMLAGKYVP